MPVKKPSQPSERPSPTPRRAESLKLTDEEWANLCRSARETIEQNRQMMPPIKPPLTDEEQAMLRMA